MFLTPKTRRLHLISVHNYPKEYFFAITNKGIGGLLKRWGPGASLIRGKWKPREQPNESEGDDDEGDLTPRRPSRSPTFVRETAPHLESPVSDCVQHEPPSGQSSRMTISPDPSFPRRPTTRTRESSSASPSRVAEYDDESMDVVTQNLTSLSLVPSSIRFGRGKQRGFASRPNRNRKPNASSVSTDDASTTTDPKTVR